MSNTKCNLDLYLWKKNLQDKRKKWFCFTFTSLSGFRFCQFLSRHLSCVSSHDFETNQIEKTDRTNLERNGKKKETKWTDRFELRNRIEFRAENKSSLFSFSSSTKAYSFKTEASAYAGLLGEPSFQVSASQPKNVLVHLTV